MKKLFVVSIMVVALALFAGPTWAAIIYVGGGDNHGTELSATVTYNISGNTLTIDIENTSNINSTITAFAFNSTLPINSGAPWTYESGTITPPQSETFGEFGHGSSLNGNWNGGNPDGGITQGNSMNFIFTFDGDSNYDISNILSQNDLGYLFVVRYQSVGLDGEGSDVGGGTSAVPIPGAAWLLGSGILGLMALRRRQQKK